MLYFVVKKIPALYKFTGSYF